MQHDFNALEARAKQLLAEGRYRDAIAVYLHMADGDPSLDAGYLAFRIGLCFEDLNDLHLARWWFGRAVEENPAIDRYVHARRRAEQVDIAGLLADNTSDSAACGSTELRHHSRMADWMNHFHSAARGLPISHVWRGYGSAIVIEIGGLTPRLRPDGRPGQPEGEIGLMIEWSWRIEDGPSIVCGSGSDEALWAPAMARLTGRAVETLSAFGRIPEVLLSLAGDLHVASFMTAEGDPAWTLFDRRISPQIVVSCRDGAIRVEP